jgi:hypothetical protein
MTNTSNTRATTISQAEFTLLAIEKLREPGFKGIHVVFSGFNKAFADYFGEDPIEVVKRLDTEGVILSRLARGGAIIYNPENAPPSLVRQRKLQDALVLAPPKPTTLERILG